MKRRAFTLLEVLIATTISVVIITWIAYFLTGSITTLYSSQNKTNLSTSFGDFVEKIWVLRTKYKSGTLIDVTDGYDIFLLTNPASTSWALVGVVSANNLSSTGYLLDTPGNFQYYGKKLLAVQELSATQLAQVKSGTWYYSIVFQWDQVYPNLYVKSFMGNTYQSWALFDVELDLYKTYNSAYQWTKTSECSLCSDSIHYQLDF